MLGTEFCEALGNVVCLVSGMDYMCYSNSFQ